MPFVVTLISNPATPAINGDITTAVKQLMPASTQAKTLHAGVALDLICHDSMPDSNLLHKIREQLSHAPIDCHLQPSEGRRKKLLIADMDSTMIQQECIDELAAELGIKEKIAAITESAMRGEIEFEPALKERVALLKGLATNIIGQTIENRITLTPGGKTLVNTMKQNGAYTALVSGGFTAFTSVIATILGFHENKANILLETDGQLSGEVAMPILGKQAKLQRLNEIMQEQNLADEETLAVGDGANDLAMIEAAGLGVAFHAKPAVAAKADACINHSDLTALLYLQGYTSSEFSQ
ncbi:phosphoserine phosphatase SerB [Polycladidibacter stylochi]|uniref:phosphoserine phosphatase SerB n=1 Tax=Polycladidibacter stylochi TaxID=1807766 RepID=UPI000834256D|nr:phosphoserine phosphatase SerB [Pseudovibrio stylochi]